MKILIFASGKGGVGKSLVSASTAIELKRRGHEVGLLDLDLHGPTQHILFPSSGRPEATREGLKPFSSPQGVKLFSLGYIFKDSPLPIKGKEKYGMVQDLTWLLDWGDIDYLIVDLPPGTGDEHLACIRAFKTASLYLVSLPSLHSISVVHRAYSLFRDEGHNPEGVILNMCWLKIDGRKIYLFGKEYKKVMRERGMEIVAELPFDPLLSKAPLKRSNSGYWRRISKLVGEIIARANRS